MPPTLEERRPMAAEKDIDRIVQSEFFSDNIPGVLIEVGAARPDYLSIGASFRERGWQVISIEPNPGFCELHRAQGHNILQYACSEEDKDDVDFYVVNSNNETIWMEVFPMRASLPLESKTSLPSR
jgi:hypothetical protein